MKQNNNNIWFALGIIGQVGFIIAVPVAILAYFGAKIDKLYHTTPLFILSGMGLSILISSMAIYYKIKRLEK